MSLIAGIIVIVVTYYSKWYRLSLSLLVVNGIPLMTGSLNRIHGKQGGEEQEKTGMPRVDIKNVLTQHRVRV